MAYSPYNSFNLLGNLAWNTPAPALTPTPAPVINTPAPSPYVPPAPAPVYQQPASAPAPAPAPSPTNTTTAPPVATPPVATPSSGSTTPPPFNWGYTQPPGFDHLDPNLTLIQRMSLTPQQKAERRAAQKAARQAQIDAFNAAGGLSQAQNYDPTTGTFNLTPENYNTIGSNISVSGMYGGEVFLKDIPYWQDGIIDQVNNNNNNQRLGGAASGRFGERNMRELLRGYKSDSKSRMGTTGGGSEESQGTMDPNMLASLNPYLGTNVVSFAQGGSYPPHNILTDSGAGFGGSVNANVPNLQVYTPPPTTNILTNSGAGVSQPKITRTTNVPLYMPPANLQPQFPVGPGGNHGTNDPQDPSETEGLPDTFIDENGNPVYGPLRDAYIAGTYWPGKEDELYDTGKEDELYDKRKREGMRISEAASRLGQKSMRELLRGYKSDKKSRMGTTGGGSESSEEVLDPNLLALLNEYLGTNIVSFNQGGHFTQQANEAIAINQLSGILSNIVNRRMPRAAYGMKMKKRYTNGGRF